MPKTKQQKIFGSIKRSASRTFFVAAAISVLSVLPLGERIENVVAHPMEFKLRQWLNREPTLDSRLRIYVAEDSTVQYLKKEGLSLSEFTTVLEGFQNQHPRAALIAKVFGIPLNDSDVEAFKTKLRALPFPVIAAGFVVPSPIQSRPLLPPYNLLGKMIEGSSKASQTAADLEGIPVEPGNTYGPAENIRGAFKYVGHAMYGGDNFVQLLVRTSIYEGLPAAALFVARDFHLEKGSILADGTKIPTSQTGRTLINFITPSAFYERTDAIKQLLELKKAGKPFPTVPKDSVILILPNQFSGNTDFKETPFGIQPGGIVMASLVNSVLTGRWIQELPFKWFFPLIAGLSTAVMISLVSGQMFWVWVLAGIVTFTGIGLTFFVYADIVIPWFFCDLSLSLSAFVVFMFNLREMLRRRIDGVAGRTVPIEVVYNSQSGQPKRLGRYEIIESIGRGGMGEVYRAKSEGAGGFEKEFALKRIVPEYWTVAHIEESFLKEAKLCSHLEHSNIVQVYELLKIEDSFLLVMEYVNGKSLSYINATLKKTGRIIPPTIAVYIVRQICRALEYAHALRDSQTRELLHLVHRDISPHNILISHLGAVKLIDFGIAQGTFTDSKTQTGVVKGKLAYMSPEQASAKTVDQRSDLFSLTLVLYELLTGRRPIVEKSVSDLHTLTAVQEWQTSSLELNSFSIPEVLKSVLKKGLEREPNARYQGAYELGFELSHYLREHGTGEEEKELKNFLSELNTPISLDGTIAVKVA